MTEKTLQIVISLLKSGVSEKAVKLLMGVDDRKLEYAKRKII